MFNEQLEILKTKILSNLTFVNDGGVDAVKPYGKEVVYSIKDSEYRGIKTDSHNYFYIRPDGNIEYDKKDRAGCGNNYLVKRNFKLVAITMNADVQKVLSAYTSNIFSSGIISSTNDNAGEIYATETGTKEIKDLQGITIISIDFELQKFTILNKPESCGEQDICIC